MKTGFVLPLVVASCALLSGCATYVVPSGRADFAAFAHSENPRIAESFAAKPAAQLPASLAFVRVQNSGYESFSTRERGGVYGNGRYSIITTREVENEADLLRVAGLPQVADIIGLSRMLLPQRLESDVQLREAAAKLKADMLVIYTFDTSFHANDASKALNVLTLGLSPTRKVHVNVTASALVMDTRTGFIYAALESSERRELISNVLETGGKVDQARRDAEKEAFKKLVGEFERGWDRIAWRSREGV